MTDATVGSAPLWTLEQGLGPACTPAVPAAWTDVYDRLAAKMQAAADSASHMTAPKDTRSPTNPCDAVSS